MFGKRITVLKLLGFEIRIELSWLILAALIVWSLSSSTFPASAGGLSRGTYWWMGIAGALGLFGSVIVHELCHSLVARRYGLSIKGITLFIFGGVAELEEEPPGPQPEFVIALVGPVSSALLALGFYLLSLPGETGAWPLAITAVLGYLASINVTLAAFNIVPAFPLDGGRVLRSILWGWKDDLRWATRLASRIGMGFGYVMLGLGVLNLFLGQFSTGLWLFVLGNYLQSAARLSYRQMFVREALQGESVRRFMQPDPVTVPPTISIRDLVEKYVYEYHFKMYPVVEGSNLVDTLTPVDESTTVGEPGRAEGATLVGCVTTRAINQVPREQWDQRTVGSLIHACSPDNTIASTADALEALSQMSSTRNSRLMVVDGGKLVGVITLKDMLDFLSIKVDLEG